MSAADVSSIDERRAVAVAAAIKAIRALADHENQWPPSLVLTEDDYHHENLCLFIETETNEIRLTVMEPEAAKQRERELLEAWEILDDIAAASLVAERDATDTGERMTMEELLASQSLGDTDVEEVAHG